MIEFTIISNWKIIFYPLEYIIRKDTSSPDYNDTRDVHIIYNTSVVGNMFTKDSRKAMSILKELTIGS